MIYRIMNNRAYHVKSFDNLTEKQANQFILNNPTCDYIYSLKMPSIEQLLQAKQNKLDELSHAKNSFREKGLLIGEYVYFSTPLDLQKYEHALKTGKRVALKANINWEEYVGTIKVKTGLIEVNGAEFDVAIETLDIFMYTTWKKEQYYIEAINNATTIEEVEAIVWEDNYNG